jgi:hypothetical protein
MNGTIAIPLILLAATLIARLCVGRGMGVER